MAFEVPTLKTKNITKIIVKRKGIILAYLTNRNITRPPIRRIATNGIVMDVYCGKSLYTAIGKRILKESVIPHRI
jgi:hypothetical protein